MDRITKGTASDCHHLAKQDSGKVWVFFATEASAALFERLANRFISAYENVYVTVVSHEFFFHPVNMSIAHMLMLRSDLFFVDLRYVFDPDYDYGPNTSSGRLTDILESLPYGCASHVLFYEDPSHLDKLKHYFNTREKHARVRVPRLDMDRAVQFSPQIDADAFDAFYNLVSARVNEIQRSKVFLCHASEDAEFVERLAHKLISRGVPVWYSAWRLRVGDSIVENINQGLRESRYMGVVLSEDSVDKPWCKREMSAALQTQLGDEGITILPIIIGDCDVPPLFKDLLWADFRTSFDDGLAKLLEAITSE